MPDSLRVVFATAASKAACIRSRRPAHLFCQPCLSLRNQPPRIVQAANEPLHVRIAPFAIEPEPGDVADQHAAIFARAFGNLVLDGGNAATHGAPMCR